MSSSSLSSRLFTLPRYQKTLIVAALDASITVCAGWAAIYLRIGQSHWLHGFQFLAVGVPLVLAPPIFYATGLYRTIFRHTGATDLSAIARACLIFGAVYATLFTVIGVPSVPRTIGLIQPLLTFVALIAVRASAFQFLRPRARTGHEPASVVIYGAGETGRQLAAGLRNDPHLRVVAFIDDDVSLQDRTAQGLRVYAPRDVQRLISSQNVSKVFIAIPTASRHRRREIVEEMGNVGLEIRMVTGLVDMAKGQVDISDIRPVQIEDLLGREPVKPDQALLERDVRDRVVMVTGGGGSIGSELCRQLLAAHPRCLILVDASEYALYTIERELIRLCSQYGLETEILPVLGFVQDEPQMRAIFARHRPETVYHAAAYKHVPLVEANPLRGLENNSLGTFVTAALAQEFCINSFVLISTDKAVRPTNVMGATKRLAELAIQALASQSRGTRFSCVRFGNVLGSSGSVVPLFREQIQTGGPVTITHRDVTRYFMTIPEAAQLVIQAGAMAKGGDIFLLEMGDPVRVVDLAANMIHLSGLTVRNADNPDGDIEITFVGLRPGEKLFEELLIDSSAEPTEHSRIMRAYEPYISLDAMLTHISSIRGFLAEDRCAAAVALLHELVPGYTTSPLCD